jgi:hypothetical protein
MTLTDCTIYNVGNYGLDIAGNTTSGQHVIDGVITIKTTGFGITHSTDSNTILQNCRAVSATTSGIYISPPAAYTGTINNLVAHSNTQNGIIMDSGPVLAATELYAWKNNAIGLSLTSAAGTWNLTGGSIFGNGAQGIKLSLGANGNFNLTNLSVYGNAGAGVYFASVNMEMYNFHNCALGPNNSADIQLAGGNSILGVLFNNCTFQSSTEISSTSISNISGGDLNNGIMISGYQGNAANHRCIFKNCIITTDHTIFNTAAPSERIAPTATSPRSKSSSKFINLNSGDSSTVKVWVRKSSDTQYTGVQPRLMLRQNYLMGITTDSVLATAAAANGVWEQLTGTITAVSATGVVEVFVDCGTTTGYINVDDWTVI